MKSLHRLSEDTPLWWYLVDIVAILIYAILCVMAYPIIAGWLNG